MPARSNHAQEKVRPVILDGAAQHLLVDGDGRSTLDAAQGMDSSTNAQVTYTLDIGSNAFLLASSFLAILDGNFGKTDTNGANIAAEYIPTIQRLAGPDSIVKTLKVN
jgi:hypothetical protein